MVMGPTPPGTGVMRLVRRGSRQIRAPSASGSVLGNLARLRRPRWSASADRAVPKPALGDDSAINEVEVGRVMGEVFGDLPASGDRVPVIADPRGEAL